MKASLVTNFYLNNKIFNIDDPKANRDDCLYRYYLLRETFRSRGVELATCDIHPPSDSDFVICYDVTNEAAYQGSRSALFLVLLESEVIKPQNWSLERHAPFEKVFTWHDEYVDNKKYFKINFSQKFPELNEAVPAKEKLCVMIAGNKMVRHPLELYSARVEAIRWFERNHQFDFDLYGMGWNEYCSSSHYLQTAVRKIPLLSRLLSSRYPSYVGSIENKRPVMEKYKFAICYENAINIPGYITEKIFDCFFAGCVPVYLGANNIADHIPAGCYIDKARFPTYQRLYKYLTQMQDTEYEAYQANIFNFLRSESAQQFSAEYFAKTIVDQVLGESF